MKDTRPPAADSEHPNQFTAPRAAYERVLIVGWDGASLDLAKEWAAQGKLPAINAMLAAGCAGYLTSTIPPLSAPAWASFATGTNPGRHGIYHFREHVHGTYESRLVKGGDRRAKPLWQLLNEQGKQAGIVNLVMTWPPEPLDGFMISGLDTPSRERQFTFPSELADEIKNAVGEYPFESLVEEARNFRYDELWTKIEREMQARIATTRYLLKNKPWDLFAVNFEATDRVQHHFWKFMASAGPRYDPRGADAWGTAIERVYRQLDGFLGEILGELDERTLLVVMSDHGFGPVGDTALHLNNWLAHEGFLKFKNEDKGARSDKPAASKRSKLWSELWVRLRQITPQAIKDLAEKLAPRLYQRIRYPAAYFLIDWPNSRAYADEYQESIWINLAGREPNGAVKPGAEYETLRDQIIERLLALRHPVTGAPVVAGAYRREALYSGSEVDRAPDIIVIPEQDPFVQVRDSHTVAGHAPVRVLSADELRDDYMPSGSHRLDGMVLAVGNGVKAAHQLSKSHICDLAPTALAALGCQIPTGLDGRVITDMFLHPPAAVYFDAESSSLTPPGDHHDPGDYPDPDDYSEEDARLVRDRLRGMGYLR